MKSVNMVKLKRVRVECEVSGAMATVLRVLRLFGVAPLRFTCVRDVYRISHSSIIFLLGSMFIFLINIILISMFCLLLFENSIHTKEGITILSTLALPNIVITSVAVLKGKHRMEYLMTIINQIERVRTRIKYDYTFDPTARNVILTMFGILLFNSAIYLLNLTFDLRQNIPSEAICLSVAIQLGHSIMLMLQMQYLFLATILRLTAKAINRRLSQCTAHEDSHSAYKKIYDLSRSYHSICEVVTKLVQAEGLLSIMILFKMVIRILITIYKSLLVYPQFATSIYSKQKFILLVMWILNNSIQVVLLIEPFHRLNNEMVSTKVVVSRLLTIIPRGSGFHDALDSFIEQFLFKQSTFTPLGLFNFSRPLIATIVGCVITFLLINDQFGRSK